VLIMLDSFVMEPQAERSSGVITATLNDETGAPVPLASMTALTLTLYDQATRGILNSRQNQNVLNANNVTMGAANGLVTWAVQPADQACVSGKDETHVALFVAKWAAGAKEHAWEVRLVVDNLDYYP
jgi:hypothetical protein